MSTSTGTQPTTSKKTLSGIPYTSSTYDTNHEVFDRIGDPAPHNTGEVRILTTDAGVRVDFAGITGRTFPRIQNLNIVGGKPLYIARLPDGETDYWTNHVLVYGTTEYLGPEHITQVVGVSGGDPIFIGVTYEDRESWVGVVHGRRHMLQFDCISDRMRIYSGMLTYAAAERSHEREGLVWYAVIGTTKYGPFDREPLIECTVYADQMYDVDGHDMAEWLKVTGEHGGRQHSEMAEVRLLLAKQP